MSKKCALCGMQIVAGCADKCGGRRIIFCPKCYTDGIQIENSLHKYVNCQNCLDRTCSVSLFNNYIGDC